MCETTHARGVDFAGDNEGGGVGAKVEEELQNNQSLQIAWEKSYTHLGYGEANEFAGGAETSVVARDDPKHERTNEEPLDLDPTTTKNLDEEYGKEVPGHVSSSRNDQIATSVLD